MAQLPKPRIRVGGLSQKVYVVTHGKEIKNDKGTFLEASRKYDATADFEDVARELGWAMPAAREALEHALKEAEDDDEFDRTESIALYKKALGGAS